MSSNTQMRISRHGPKSFLTAMLPLIVALSLICVLLPRDIADDYTLRLMQLSLFIGFICALRAAQTHLRELRNVFLFIALFILFMLLSNTVTFWDALIAVFGWSPYLSLIIAGIAYVMLIISCIYVIKIIHIQKLLMYEWAIIGIMSIVSIVILVYPLTTTKDLTLDLIISVLFRFFDVMITLMLLPVILLYRHQSTIESKESITFTIAIVGIILSTIGDWILEIVSGISHQELSQMFHTGSLLDSVYLFSYLLIALGLYVHISYGALSLKHIDDGFKLNMEEYEFEDFSE